MRIAIHQPNLFPRLKVLRKIAQADAWVVLDDVQYVSREWQNRAYVRHLHSPAQAYWLTVPVHLPHGRASLISEVQICDHEATRSYIFKSVSTSYSRSPHWPWLNGYLHSTLRIPTHRLSPLCERSMTECLRLADIDRTAILSSALGVNSHGTQKLVDICLKVGASAYLSGSGGKNYLDEALFTSHGIRLDWQAWRSPAVPEISNVLPWRDVSFIDFFARHGLMAFQGHLSDAPVRCPEGSRDDF